MTKEDKIKAFEMRMDGMTFQEIGDHFGVTQQCIEACFKPERKRKPINRNFKCIYPGLKKWMLENRVSIMKMHDDLHLYDSPLSMYRNMKTEGMLTIDRIKKILAFTGLTFEEAFGEEVSLDGGSDG